ncbi:hypothetical protein CspeluHIS016_0309200 [Cutaneotrichosporon spelunceum]|uniref:Myb/SANT-like domain-containing protein n=1 Tax=Cutaneotrichosporon spelunceum TaxID=1672016 RepID=A0AAD3YBI4_9TREE|nr:hypothetical protein CspeluHIS016_0309200 [Cutaneotrichosporon spelunceum]
MSLVLSWSLSTSSLFLQLLPSCPTSRAHANQDVLLRHREKGRTADNGFEPEVWQEAAKSLESTNGTGGEKTPDACRSRWQRLQREFKFAREYLEECPGFSWDRNKHKLQAADESWAAAESKGHQTKKGRKIYLPWFQGLSQLCPGDSRIRPTKARVPSSGSSASETSGAVLAHAGVVRQTPGLSDGTHIMSHVNGPHNGVPPNLSVPEPPPVWADEGDNSVETVDNFGLPDPNHQAFAMPSHKRPLEYDVSPQYTPTINDPALPSPVYPPLTIGNGDMGSSLLRTPQQSTEARREMMVARTDKPRPDRTLTAAASMPSLTGASHVRSKSGGNIIIPPVSSAGGLALSGLTPKTTGMTFSPGGELQPLATTAIAQPKSGVGSGGNTPGPTGSPESDAGARRIEAVRRLQLEELPDDDIMLILPEFEQSNAVVETYLGLNRDILRTRWLADKVMVRRLQLERARRADEFESAM